MTQSEVYNQLFFGVRFSVAGQLAHSVDLLYRNPDGSYGVLLLNENAVEAKVVFTTDRHSVTCKVPPMAIQSVRWKE